MKKGIVMNLPSMIDIPIEYITQIKDDFYNSPTYTTNGMKKVVSIKKLKSVNTLVEYLGFDINCMVGDNYYKHTRSYFPHVDAPADDCKKYLHIVIPLEKEYDDTQHFIIFDQYSKIGPATWTGLLDVDIDFETNIQVKGNIREQDITNFIKSGITDEFAKKYLPYPKEWYNGLSATAYEWTPGKGIMFPSNRLHASGNMPRDMYKLGITFKFKLPNDVY